ncbi:hypothetical protein [uncultured Algibacter sp.]|uniref:hypothetical protein n=1 Tax=uncultured Algibacter sp. TaxID=298659 RepID=UPI00263731AF|nr:hypothetical protein [uncultured Algibacter sp.]
MKKITFLSILILVFSCKKEEQPYFMYGLLSEEFIQSSEIVEIQVSENLYNNELIKNKSARVYDSLTKEYLNYLEKICTDLVDNKKIIDPTDYEGEVSKKEYSNDFFFTKETYSKKGIEFISKTEKYRIEILKLVKDKNLKKRINGVCATMDFRTRNRKKIRYLDYFYKDTPLVSVLAHIRHKQNSIIKIENEFLKNILINEQNSISVKVNPKV